MSDPSTIDFLMHVRHDAREIRLVADAVEDDAFRNRMDLMLEHLKELANKAENLRAIIRARLDEQRRGPP